MKAKVGSSQANFSRTGALAFFALALGLLIGSLSTANSGPLHVQPIAPNLASTTPV